jgi:hypothetical protein
MAKLAETSFATDVLNKEVQLKQLGSLKFKNFSVNCT